MIYPERDYEMAELMEILHKEKCSCVLYSEGSIMLCYERGVKDLYRLLNERPDLLNNAMIADKVIGKGAAALMIIGGVSEIYADVISSPALDLLASAGIRVSFKESVPNIINRTGTGICPVESLCMKAQSAEECIPLIGAFIQDTLNTK